MDERRTELLDAALEVVVVRGFAGATLDAVAARAGVTKPVIYSAFTDRDAFFAALLDREEQRAMVAVTAAMPDLAGLATATPARLRATVADGVAGLIRAVRHDPAPWRLILTDPAVTPPAVARRIRRDRGLILDAVEALVERGLAIAGIRRLDPELLAHALFAAVERLVRLAAERPDIITPERAGSTIAALLPAGPDPTSPERGAPWPD